MSYTLQNKTWMDFFVDIPDEIPEKKNMDLARDHLKKKALLDRPSDSVGASDQDLRDTDGCKDVQMPVRALMGRAIRAANVISEEVKKRRMIATPQQSSKSLETSIVQAAGRDASGGVIAAAVQSALDEKWTISGLLGQAGLAHTSQFLIGPIGSWALCKAEVDNAGEEKRQAHAYVEFLDKAMIATWLPAEATGGRSGITGEDASNVDKEKLKDINEALKSLSETPRFFRNLNQWNATYDRFTIMAVCTKMMTWLQLTSYRQVIARIAEEAKTTRVSELLAVVYDEIHRKELRDRCQRKDPDLKLDEEFRTINKENLDIARAKLPTILKNVRVVGAGGSAGGGQSSLGAIGSAHLAASDQFRIQQNSAARVMADTNVNQLLGSQQAPQNGGARVVQQGGRQPPPAPPRPSRRAADLPPAEQRPVDAKTGKPLSNKKMKSKLLMSGAKGVKH